VLELATGSGNVAEFLPNDNNYIGIDISSGLLRLAKKKLDRGGFSEAKLYNADATDLPFQDDIFDRVICQVSLHFFSDIELAVKELKRVIKPRGVFCCSVPVTDKKPEHAKIRGTLYSTGQLRDIIQNHGLYFFPLTYENGALLYFQATPNNDL
jgi:ubiquinone/menaquinone biosynthesis C-methylase UbiE